MLGDTCWILFTNWVFENIYRQVSYNAW